MTEKKTVLSKKVVGRRRALADSDESSTECEKELLLPSSSTDFCRNCCTCNNNARIYKPKSREKQQLSSVDSHLSRTSYREQLEMKVLNEQVSQQVSSEQWRNLENQLFRLNEASFILNTLFNSIHVTSTCLVRLARLVSDQDSQFDERCEDICDKINDAIDITRDNEDIKSHDETDDFLSRKSNLTKASTNFADILRRSSIPSNKQLSKLEKQYDDIRTQYVDAKSKALLRMNGSIQKKTETLNDNFRKHLIPVLTICSDLERQIVSFLGESSVDSIKKRLETTKSWSESAVGKVSNSNTGACSNGGAGDARRRNCTCCDSSN